MGRLIPDALLLLGAFALAAGVLMVWGLGAALILVGVLAVLTAWALAFDRAAAGRRAEAEERRRRVEG